MEARSYDVSKFLPEGEIGAYKISRFTVTGEEFQGFTARYVPKGTYTKLVRGGTLVMSDTPDEHRDHSSAIYKAKGRVLIAGLGIGMVANEMLKKPEVEHLTVIEVSEEVIALTGPHLKALHGDRLTIVHADIFTYTPPKGELYDTIWFDVWDYICEDNLAQMEKLHRKYARRKRTKEAFMHSWARGLCQRYRAQSSRQGRYIRW